MKKFLDRRVFLDCGLFRGIYYVGKNRAIRCRITGAGDGEGRMRIYSFENTMYGTLGPERTVWDEEANEAMKDCVNGTDSAKIH